MSKADEMSQVTFYIPEMELNELKKISKDNKMLYPTPSHLIRVLWDDGLKWLEAGKPDVSAEDEQGMKTFSVRLPLKNHKLLEKAYRKNRKHFVNISHMLRVFVRNGLEGFKNDDK